MKVIIWILTLFVGSLVNILIGNALGIRAGALLLYIGECFIARKLCGKWDDHVAKKASYKHEPVDESSNNAIDSNISNITKQIVTNNHSENNSIPERVLSEEKTIRNDNTAKSIIDSEYGPIVFYADASPSNKMAIHYVGFCKQCGAAFGKDSIYCDKCGAKIEQKKYVENYS